MDCNVYSPGSILDLSAQGVQKLDPSFVCSDDTHTLILDRNHIMKLDHLERSPGLQQVSQHSSLLHATYGYLCMFIFEHPLALVQS